MRAVRIRAVIVGLVAGLSLGGQSGPVAASPYHPTGGYAPFGDCPLASPHKLGDCISATVGGGSVVIGRRTVAIDEPIAIQGGYYKEAGTKELTFVGAEDGNTLVSSPLSVPGGLQGLLPPGSLPAPLQAQSSASPAAVTITMQLAAPASEIGLSTQNVLEEEGVGLRLPVRMKLNNQFLGSNCYIGSPSSPVVLSLTTGITSPPAPNKPIAGTAGHFQLTGSLLTGEGTVLVDNSFSAPVATGCGGVDATFLDRVLNTTMGLPSPPGRNTAILDGAFDVASPTAVRESE